MTSQTFSAVERKGQVSLTAAAAVVALGSLAVLPPAGYNNDYAMPDYAITTRHLSSGGFMDLLQKNQPTHTSVDMSLLQPSLGDFADTESFVTPLVQGLQFIQKIGFIEGDDSLDKELDTYFSKRPLTTKKLFVNPFHKQV